MSMGIQTPLLFRYIGMIGLNRIAIVPKAISHDLEGFPHSVMRTMTAPIVIAIRRNV